jgi:hypothetical protein
MTFWSQSHTTAQIIFFFLREKNAPSTASGLACKNKERKTAKMGEKREDDSVQSLMPKPSVVKLEFQLLQFDFR